jgi:hypothetical protein
MDLLQWVVGFGTLQEGREDRIFTAAFSYISGHDGQWKRLKQCFPSGSFRCILQW